MYPPIHVKPEERFSFDRLNMLWERYPAYHERTTFGAMNELIKEHESWQKEFEEVREEYFERDCDPFLVQLSWADLPYRYAAKELLEKAGEFPENAYVTAFLEQFGGLDTDREAFFLIPESFLSQFIVAMEVCKRAKELRPVKNLFPDEETAHYLAVFDKQNMDDVLLMHHLDVFGGYSLYEYPLIWYQTHLREEGIVLRSPYLPDRLARYQGSIPFCHDPVKTVYVRRNIEHILECGYFGSELEFFENLTRRIMPLFQWWYTDRAIYEEKDGFRTDWRLARTRIRTRLTAEGTIRPKWKHELSLFHAVRNEYPDTLYQYRPDWLGRQSLDLYIPSIRTGIEYQGIQHFLPVEFFGGEEALKARQELDIQKKKLCAENEVRLIEWPYSLEPTDKNVRELLGNVQECLEKLLKEETMTYQWNSEKTINDFYVKINGLDVHARYSDRAVKDIFLPFLEEMTDLHRRKQRRILIMLAAPPGAGKSTLLAYLEKLSAETAGLEKIQTIGIDGFHRYQDYLLTHTTVRGGEEIPMVRIKGAPETFDLEKLTKRVREAAAGEVCGWPQYDRLLHNPVEDAVTVDGGIILLEGNYLLLNEDGWRDLKQYADYTVMIRAKEDLLRDRLIKRRMKTGVPEKEAAEFVDYSDMVNVRTCLTKSMDADLTLLIDNNDDYKVVSEEPHV